MNERDKLLLLMSYHEISNKKQEELLDALEDFSIDKVLAGSTARQILSTEEIKKLLDGYDERVLENSIQNMENSGIKILTVFSDEYPEKLLNLPERPLILFAKGDLSLLKQRCFGMVGTRMPSAYGKIVTEKFAKKLAQSGLVIVSGLCYGVDAISHRATLDAKGKTIAIVGSGFGHIYPATNTNLAKEIASSGLLLSEYPPSFEPKRYTFPRRNRIIAGVCDGVLITEAGIKSGTLHTKEYALMYGKDIFAVPGNVTNDKSELPNLLIKTAQAECVTSADDIINFYGLESVAKNENAVSLNFDEQAIINLLQSGEKNFDFLAEKTKIPVNILNSCLTTLEIRGLIRKLPAQMFGLL